MFSSKKTPLMHCEIKHSLPGRVRIACRGLRYLETQRERVAHGIEECAAINSASISTRNRQCADLLRRGTGPWPTISSIRLLLFWGHGPWMLLKRNEPNTVP